MRNTGSLFTYACVLATMFALAATRDAAAADIYVPAGSSLQSALDAAVGGDTILLTPGVVYIGNFKLPVHAGTGYVTVRTASTGAPLPAAGSRITPAASPYLARLASANSTATVRTAAGAAYWRLELLEVGPGPIASTTLVELGDGSSAQNLAGQVPHHLVLDRVYVHGDPLAGQKRGIGLNSADTAILGSYVSEIKAVGADSQAVAGWNGPGPYRIENNYFEAAGTAVLFGGDDPKIADLVPSDIVFRDNTVTRPVSWRSPILATPTGVRASFAAGGSLAAGTYGYRVVARRLINSTTVKSSAAAEVSVTVTAGAAATIQWSAVPHAADYLVYGRTVGAENRYWVVKGTSFTDDGVAASASGTPSSATLWQLKNLFELKNARRVQVDHNLLANNWAQAQSGTAILFTTRNQGGACSWCVVEQVTFENNAVLSIGGGFQITGWDNLQPSLQGHDIRVRNNLIADLSKSWGGKGYMATITDGPRDITFDHNTIISPDGSGIVMADGVPISGFVFTNNVARHNSYGIFGSGYGIGNKAIPYYFPNSVITGNVLAGGSASAYPSGNFFPSVAGFESHFADYAGASYALVPGTDWQAAGTDGLDLGADMTKIAGAGGASATPGPTAPPLQIDTTSLPSTIEGLTYSTLLTASGGAPPYAWTVVAGTLPGGLLLDFASGTLSGSALIAGDFPFAVQVRDAAGTTTAQNLAIHVDRAIPPVSITTAAINTITATVPFSQALDASGGLGSYRWSTSSALPSGLTLSASGVVSGTTSAQGTYAVAITATDAQDASRSATQSYSVYVAPPPNHPPTVSLAAPADGSIVPVGMTITLTANAADIDGNLSRVDFYAEGTFIGSSTGPVYSVPWLVAASGTYRFSAIATDARGEVATSQTATVTATSEIVLYAADATRLAGNYQLTADPGAAGGVSLWNPDLGAAKIGAAAAAPASFAEFTFYAEAGRPYHLWIRGHAQKNSWANDSAYAQFSTVSAARIGTTGSMTYNLEEASNAGISGWGWEDNGWGTGVLGADIVFDTTGRQTIRIQPREDGLYIDQIVLSPQRFLTTSPGALKNDTTIVGR